MHFTIRVEWRRHDGTTATEELVTQNQDSCKSAGDVGLPLAEAKRIVAWLQAIVVNEQLEQYCETARRCPACGEYRPLKDNRQRRFYTVLGKLTVKAPRFEGCRACKDRPCVSPVSELLRDRVSPELRYLQAKFAAQLPYRQAADLLRELLPESGGLNHATTRNRTLAVGRSLDRELCREIEHPQVPAEPATEMVVGIDGAFVKAITSGIRQKQSLEILTGRVETTPRGGDAFAVVRNLEDGKAKQRVQAILRRCGRGPDTKVRLLSDGEDGLRGVVGWFGKRCEHRLDWFHVSRRIDSIGKQLLYLPESPVYGWRLAFHSKNLHRIKWQLWNHGVEMADWGMKTFRAGLAEDAWDSPKLLERFQSVELKLDELRSYLYANKSAVRGYAKAFRQQKRVSTAHVESTVNQLINWRMCKKQQMRWSKAGAHCLLQVKTAAINGQLQPFIATHPIAIAA
jgi:hypothetical protein